MWSKTLNCCAHPSPAQRQTKRESTLNFVVNVLNTPVIVHIKRLKSAVSPAGRGQIESEMPRIRSEGSPSLKIMFSLDCLISKDIEILSI